MNAMAWLPAILLGGVLGMVGQGVRVVIGLKKTVDEAQKKQTAFSDEFQWSLLVTSLIIGFVAGVIASVMVSKPDQQLTTDTVLGFMAAGYAGTDFIEGMFQKYLPKKPAAAGG